MPGKPMRLPPLPMLQIKDPQAKPEPHCVQVMATVLGCWAAAGYNTAGCAVLEQQLRKCMDGSKPAMPPHNAINSHLARLKRNVNPTPFRKGKPFQG
ncbi:hypothetical protein BROUX41_003285 [Berkeleyomyces rouxiae]|uniref:uncharacterized protein n=1 Tax=Berkeleyomyces rouxiae TaxID=2035830 RepID=UPI003B7669D2